MKRFFFPFLLGLSGVAVLVSLGVWQLQRHAWKQELLTEIEARIASEAIDLPAEVSPETDAYLAVRLTGEIDGPAIPVFGTWRGAGVGYRIIVPVLTGERRVLVDLGVAGAAEPDLPGGRLSIWGNLNWPGETEPDPGSEVWTNLDVPAMADRLGTEPVLVVTREIVGGPSPAIPVPVGTEGIPDNHLGYAVQWFGLAAVWAGMTAFLLWRIHAAREERG